MVAPVENIDSKRLSQKHAGVTKTIQTINEYCWIVSRIGNRRRPDLKYKQRIQSKPWLAFQEKTSCDLFTSGFSLTTSKHPHPDMPLSIWQPGITLPLRTSLSVSRTHITPFENSPDKFQLRSKFPALPELSLWCDISVISLSSQQ